MPPAIRASVGAVLVGLLLLVAAAGVFAWSRSGVPYPYDGHGISRLLDRLVADLNARDEGSIAALASGGGLTKSLPPSGRATDTARSWINGYGGRGLHASQYRWRRDLDGLRTQVEVKAMTATLDPVAVWLTISGSAVDLDHSKDLASVLSGPEEDMRIGAAPLVLIPTSDGDGHVARVWIAAMGWGGAAILVAGLALGVSRRAASPSTP